MTTPPITSITDELIAELELLADKATPGDWWIDSHGSTMMSLDSLDVVFQIKEGKSVRHPETGNLSCWPNDWDASFIATANPSTIKALLAERADLKQQLVAAGITAHNCELFRKDAERYQWLRENKFQVTDGDMHGPGYPRLADFSFDLWAKRPSTHNVAGLDAAIDAAMRQ